MSSNRPTPKLAAALFFVATALAPGGAAADTAYLVKDINVTSGGAGSDPQEMIRLGDVVYFTAADGDHGRELWKTDGTEEGTVLVADIARGTASSNPHGLTVHGETLYFFADDGINGPGLWRSNGFETGTKLVRAVPGGAPFGDGRMRAAGDVLYFLASVGEDGLGLWRTDGTVEGTQIALPKAPGPAGSFFPVSPPVQPVALGNALLFTVFDETVETATLWRTFGTPASTTVVKSADSGKPNTLGGFAISLLTRVGDTVFFATSDTGGGALWKTDGTAEGTVLMTTVGASSLTGLTEVNGQLFFAQSPTLSCISSCIGLWKSDGTKGGTQKIADVQIVSDNILIDGGWRAAFVKAGDDFFFEAIAPQPGLWKSDGTPAGTKPVKQIPASFPGPGELVDLQGTLLFTNSSTLWRSDGTADGTVPISNASSLSGMTALGARLIFQGDDGRRGAELWTSDGTEAGTSLLRDIEPGGQKSNPAHLTDANGVLYFTADDGVHGTELWKSDGTEARTSLVADLTPGPESTRINWLEGLGSAVLISLTNDADEAELWISDDAGPRLLHRFGPSVGTGPLRNGTLTGPLGPVDGALYLWVSSQIAPYGSQLWRCDGSKTALVAEVAGEIFAATTDGKRVYFSESGPGYGALWLWRTDGTPAGTTRMTHGPMNIVVLDQAGGKVFFNLERELWFADASSDTPTRVLELESTPSAGGTLGREVLFFVPSGATEDDASWSLWKSDGTGRGTKRLAALPHPPEAAASSGDTFYFQLVEPSSGVISLWASDGTAAGTRLVHEPLQSMGLPVPLPNGSVIFSAGDTSVGGHGIEPWISDGTRAGTVEIQQVGRNARSSTPLDFTVSGQRVFFTADDGVRGREVWAMPLPTTPQDASGCACAAPGRLDPSRPALLVTAVVMVIARRRNGRRRSR